MRDSLDVQIENIARKYGFRPRVNHKWVDENKAFLAMLDEYVSRTGYQLPETIRGIDIGCGEMRYADGLITFLERYGKNNGQIRPVHLVGVEGGEDLRPDSWDPLKKAIKESKLSPTKLDLVYQWLHVEENMDDVIKETGVDNFNIATIFSPGPDTGVTKDVIRVSRALKSLESQGRAVLYGRTLDRSRKEELEELYSLKLQYLDEGVYITYPIKFALKPRMAEGGLLIVCPVEDGAPADIILKKLREDGFYILLSEENKFAERFWNWRPNTNDYIIIAKNTNRN